jgi:hypothetical protein
LAGHARTIEHRAVSDSYVLVTNNAADFRAALA